MPQFVLKHLLLYLSQSLQGTRRFCQISLCSIFLCHETVNFFKYNFWFPIVKITLTIDQ